MYLIFLLHVVDIPKPSLVDILAVPETSKDISPDFTFVKTTPSKRKTYNINSTVRQQLVHSFDPEQHPLSGKYLKMYTYNNMVIKVDGPPCNANYSL